ncbi:MAG: NAD-dependent deacylase [Leptospiraceae bacterium]|nr:NAD-dependent deacylase [Leptospiraceae bacterium]
MIDAEVLERYRTARRVAVITGAGISHESGIPTFRGPDGFWRKFPAHELATPRAFARNPALVWEWYNWRRGICARAVPNAAHKIVARMEEDERDFLLITQNVDNLHRRANSRAIIEIHGSIFRARCSECHHKFTLEYDPERDAVDAHMDEAVDFDTYRSEHSQDSLPHCERCGALARPDIVWFGESYDQALLGQALDFLTATQFVMVIGTSGMVPIPVYLTQHAVQHGAYAVDVNPDESDLTAIVQASIRMAAGIALPAFWEQAHAR